MEVSTFPCSFQDGTLKSRVLLITIYVEGRKESSETAWFLPVSIGVDAWSGGSIGDLWSPVANAGSVVFSYSGVLSATLWPLWRISGSIIYHYQAREYKKGCYNFAYQVFPALLLHGPSSHMDDGFVWGSFKRVIVSSLLYLGTMLLITCFRKYSQIHFICI